jgi:hypothetical protein
VPSPKRGESDDAESQLALPAQHPTHADDNLPPIMVIYTEFPECMEAILAACTRHTLFALRATNSDMREVVDGHLGRMHHVYFYHRLLAIMGKLGR